MTHVVRQVSDHTAEQLRHLAEPGPTGQGTSPRIVPDQLPGCNDPICAGQGMFLRGNFRRRQIRKLKCVAPQHISRLAEQAR